MSACHLTSFGTIPGQYSISYYGLLFLKSFSYFYQISFLFLDFHSLEVHRASFFFFLSSISRDSGWRMRLTIHLHLVRISRICGASGAHIPGARAAVATKLCMMAPNVCGSSVRNLLHVTLLTPRILRWLLDFWKICAAVSPRPIALVLNHKDNCKLCHLPSFS